MAFWDVGFAYPVLRIAGWTLYSLANTKGTIPWGNAAYTPHGMVQFFSLDLIRAIQSKVLLLEVISIDSLIVKRITWTMATRRRVPRKPMAMEAMAMTAGPVRNLMAMAKAATEFPHAIIFGCSPMKIPFTQTTLVNFQSQEKEQYLIAYDNFYFFFLYS